MDAVADSGSTRSLLLGKEELRSRSLVFDVTVANRLGPTTLTARYGLEEVVEAKRTKYGGTDRPKHKLLGGWRRRRTASWYKTRGTPLSRRERLGTCGDILR